MRLFGSQTKRPRLGGAGMELAGALSIASQMALLVPPGWFAAADGRSRGRPRRDQAAHSPQLSLHAAIDAELAAVSDLAWLWRVAPDHSKPLLRHVPSELRVARIAAEGGTNREIAQALTVTEKTIETHMRHVFQKLDIGRRTELADALESA